MRTALYARYSSDLQSAASIGDQLYKLKERVRSKGWHMAGTFSDAATSGASMLRPGLQTLLQDAAASKFDVLLCEALDRLSRNQADIARIYEQLTFHGVKIITLSEGIISELHIGLKGTMNALFLKDLADKTRRGLSGRVRAGKSGGGKSYGYDIPVKLDTNGERITGEMIINTEEASSVNRIFEMYASGLSPRAIAHTLNYEGIKGPNGKNWGPSTINGNRRRGTGILNNELYIGRRVWNRLSYIKNPATGKRVSRLNPQEEWINGAVPSLRIISDELWQTIKERQGKLDSTDTKGTPRPFHTKQRAKHFWSGKIKCSECGGSYSKISKDLLGCATSRNKGKAACSNHKNIRADILEEHLLHSLKHHLMDPALFAEFIDAFTQELNRLQGEARGERCALEKRQERITQQITKIVDAVADGTPYSSFNDKLTALEAEKLALTERLTNICEEPQMLLHPNMTHLYKETVGTLSEALKTDASDRSALEAIRSLLDKVTLTPTDTGFDFDIQGELAAILSLSVNGKHSATGNTSVCSRTTKPFELSFEGSDELAEQVKLVAGVGFEPTTFRL